MSGFFSQDQPPPPTLPISRRIWTNPTSGPWDKWGGRVRVPPSPPRGYATDRAYYTVTSRSSSRTDWLYSSSVALCQITLDTNVNADMIRVTSSPRCDLQHTFLRFVVQWPIDIVIIRPSRSMVSVLSTWVRCAKTAKKIEMPFGGDVWFQYQPFTRYGSIDDLDHVDTTRRSGPQSSRPMWFDWTTRVYDPNQLTVSSAVFMQPCTRVSNTDSQTDRHVRQLCQ